MVGFPDDAAALLNRWIDGTSHLTHVFAGARRSIWRGRAQLKLEERTDQWSDCRERRFLPGPVEFLMILLGVSWRSHKSDQRAMMLAAGRWYVLIAASIILVLCVGMYAWRDFQGRRVAPGLVADLLRTQDEDEFQLQLHDRVKPYRGWVLDEPAKQVAQQPSTDYQKVTESSRVNFGKRRADAAIAMYGLGAPDRALDVFRLDEEAGDPEALTQFVYRSMERGVQPDQLFDQLRKSSDSSARHGLLLALGEFKLDELPQDNREAWVSYLESEYEENPSSSVHSACGWLLRQWGRSNRVEKVDETPRQHSPDREWFVLKIGVGDQADFFTFIVFNEGGVEEFKMGSPESEAIREDNETLHTVRLTRTFAICDREVTKAQFSHFQPQSVEDQEAAEYPVDNVCWYDAAQYCRWLTVQAGWPDEEQCFPDPEKPDANDLNKHGFRLPTEAEWEYACRAGTQTRWSCGSDEDLLSNYAQLAFNGGPGFCGRLRPNPRGLFDMHGNVEEWCYDWFDAYTSSRGSNPHGPSEGKSRVTRGGSSLLGTVGVRSAIRGYLEPYLCNLTVGFRIALTLSGKLAKAERGAAANGARSTLGGVENRSVP